MEPHCRLKCGTNEQNSNTELELLVEDFLCCRLDYVIFRDIGSISHGISLGAKTRAESLSDPRLLTAALQPSNPEIILPHRVLVRQGSNYSIPSFQQNSVRFDAPLLLCLPIKDNVPKLHNSPLTAFTLIGNAESGASFKSKTRFLKNLLNACPSFPEGAESFYPTAPHRIQPASSITRADQRITPEKGDLDAWAWGFGDYMTEGNTRLWTDDPLHARSNPDGRPLYRNCWIFCGCSHSSYTSISCRASSVP